jgi:hypothetical protein
MAHFKVISQNFPGRSEENHEEPKSGQLSQGQDSNLESPKYKAGVLYT